MASEQDGIKVTLWETKASGNIRLHVGDVYLDDDGKGIPDVVVCYDRVFTRTKGTDYEEASAQFLPGL